MGPVCVFDVNETLLDLAALDSEFRRVFGDPGTRVTWFGQLLQSAMVATITGRYADFGTVGRAALEMTAGWLGLELSEEDREAVVGGMTRLPAHPEVPGALRRLADGGLRLAALADPPELVVADLDELADRLLA
jgi:2-haloacid dehalogenase